MGFSMANVGNDRQEDSLFIQSFGWSRTTDPPAVFLAGVLSDYLFAPGGAGWKQLTHAQRKALNIFLVKLHAAFGFPLSTAGTYFDIRKTFLFGALEGSFFHQ